MAERRGAIVFDEEVREPCERVWQEQRGEKEPIVAQRKRGEKRSPAKQRSGGMKHASVHGAQMRRPEPGESSHGEARQGAGERRGQRHATIHD